MGYLLLKLIKKRGIFPLFAIFAEIKRGIHYRLLKMMALLL